MQACCSYFMLGYTTLTVTNPFSMSRSEIVKENCKKAFFGEETRAPTKVLLALELISTIVRPKGQVLDPPMKAVDALFVVNIENVLNEKSNLFISVNFSSLELHMYGTHNLHDPSHDPRSRQSRQRKQSSFVLTVIYM